MPEIGGTGKGSEGGEVIAGRFAVDNLLRKHGWAISRRPRDSEPVWRRKGVEQSESQILDTLDPEDVADAVMEEELYFDSE